LAVVSAAVALIAPIAAWSLASSRQPAGYSSVRQTISALAAHSATDRWVMTTGLFLLGLAHLCTAIALVQVGPVGRTALGLAGAATIAVAALAQPAAGHLLAAGVAFVALCLWPVFAQVPARRFRVVITLALLALLLWFAFELRQESLLLGLSERILVAAEALCPLIVAIGVWRRGGSAAPRGRRRASAVR